MRFLLNSTDVYHHSCLLVNNADLLISGILCSDKAPVGANFTLNDSTIGRSHLAVLSTEIRSYASESYCLGNTTS